MKIDKEGFAIIRNTFIIAVVFTTALYFAIGWTTATYVVAIILFLKFCFVLRFFRLPHRQILQNDELLFSPADGKIVALEKTYEGEYFKDERIQVSIFMSIWNVHANWYPVKGDVKYFRHHHGNFLLANHPKSSTENERTTTVVGNERGEILFRQVAGYVARRIVSYAVVGSKIEQNSRCGFIKFGSRIDLFLPLDADIKVKLGDRVVGTQSIIASLKK